MQGLYRMLQGVYIGLDRGYIGVISSPKGPTLIFMVHIIRAIKGSGWRSG